MAPAMSKSIVHDSGERKSYCLLNFVYGTKILVPRVNGTYKSW